MDAVVGQPDSNSGRGWLTPLRMYILGGVIAVVLLAVGVVLWQQHNQRVREAQKVDAVIAQAEDAYDKGEYVNALNIVRQVLGKTVTHEQEVHTYQMAAQSANAAGRLKDAAKYFELKHAADPDSEAADSYALGIVYQRLKQKDKALAQFEIAIKYAEAHKTQYGSDVHAIEESIKEVKAMQ